MDEARPLFTAALSGRDNDEPKKKEEITSNSLGFALIIISFGILIATPDGWGAVAYFTWAMVFFVVGMLALMFPSKKPPSSKDSESE